jgi:LPS-assembly protein
MHTGMSRLWGADVDQTVYARVQRWQVLQSTDSSAAISPPYQRSPQIGAQWSAQLDHAELQLQTEYNRFTNTDISQPGGDRAHAIGSVGWRFGDASTQFTPRLSFNSAVYNLDQPLADGRTRVGRSVPSFSLDGRWTLERDADWLRPGLRQTLEPRLFYLRTPWRDQSQLPTFDSAPLDFNATTMFADNSFSGIDRVADANLVTAGVTSRFIDDSSGAELGQFGVAQRFLLSEQRITPDGKPLTQRVSDLFLIGSTSAGQAWGLDGALQYNTDNKRVERAVSTVRYTPERFHSLSATYRFQRTSSEQLALGFQWPLYGGAPRKPAVDANDSSPAAQAVRVAAADARDQRYASTGSCQGTLYGVGRLDYSLRDSRMSTAIVGVEYDAGCWVARLVAERQSTGSNSATMRWMLQLELVGLSRLGSNPLAILKDNIPGYTLLRESRTDPAGSASTTPGDPTVHP